MLYGYNRPIQCIKSSLPFYSDNAITKDICIDLPKTDTQIF